MPESRTVGSGKIVSIHYKLTLDDGRVVDSSEGREPLDYLHGSQNIVRGLENALEGRGIGDEFAVVVSPEDGYGEHHAEAIHVVQRTAFPPKAPLTVGTTFQAKDEHGHPLMGSIKAVEGDAITVDFNHPLAGERLNFAISVIGVREATAQERSHGHVHAHGHDH